MIQRPFGPRAGINVPHAFALHAVEKLPRAFRPRAGEDIPRASRPRSKETRHDDSGPHAKRNRPRAFGRRTEENLLPHAFGLSGYESETPTTPCPTKRQRQYTKSIRPPGQRETYHTHLSSCAREDAPYIFAHSLGRYTACLLT